MSTLPTSRLSIPPSRAVLFAAILIGFGMRASAIAARDFPLNDGGLFYSMVQDLLTRNFAPPLEASYNQAGIPFVYPPLGLYAAAVLAKVGLPLTEVFRFLPLLLSTASIIASYGFAMNYAADQLIASLAAFAIAVCPDAFLWRIMGGGITRGFGFLFGILTLDSLLSLLRRASWQSAASTGVLGAATLLSHPEATVHFGLGAVLLSAMYLRSRKAFLGVLSAAILSLSIASIWWLHLLQTNGFAAWQSALRAREWTPGYLVILQMLHGLDPATITFALLGIIAGQKAKVGWLLIYSATMFLVLPRSAAQFVILPIAILFGMGLKLTYEHVLLAPIRQGAESPMPITRTRSAAVGLLVLIMLVFVPNWIATLTSPLLNALSRSERVAMAWAAKNTPSQARFLIVEGTDFINARNAEWFPTLAQRMNPIAVQGYEWLAATDFRKQIDLYHELQQCGISGAPCVEAWAIRNRFTYDYVYVVLVNGAVVSPGETCCEALSVSLERSPHFRLAYKNPGVAIYERVR